MPYWSWPCGAKRRGWAVLALTGGFFVAQVAFNLFYAIGDIYVFYIPAYLVWVMWMAFGAWAIVLLATGCSLGRGNVHGAGRSPQPGSWRSSSWLRLPIGPRSYSGPGCKRSTDDSARGSWEALLKSDLPQGAILVSNDRDEMAPLWYLSYVEGRRRDLTGLFPLIQPGPAWSDVVRVTDLALQTGRPTYLVKPMPGLRSSTTFPWCLASGRAGLDRQYSLLHLHPNLRLIPPMPNMPERFACSATTSIPSRFDRVSRPG